MYLLVSANDAVLCNDGSFNRYEHGGNWRYFADHSEAVKVNETEYNNLLKLESLYSRNVNSYKTGRKSHKERSKKLKTITFLPYECIVRQGDEIFGKCLFLMMNQGWVYGVIIHKKNGVIEEYCAESYEELFSDCYDEPPELTMCWDKPPVIPTVSNN